MHSFTILALAQKPPVSVLDALPYLVGIVMVMMTLTTLWGVCALTARITKLVMPDAALLPVPAKAAASHPGPAAPIAPAGIAPEIIAVIAAAVATTTGPPHRIVSIHPQSATWSKAGRQSVFSSHRIR